MSTPTLHGNQGELENIRPLTFCTLDTPLEEMQRRYWEDGVLWVKGLVDPKIINKFWGEYLAMIGEGNNMLKPGSDSRDGIFNPDADWREFLLGGVRVAAGIPNEGPFVEKAFKAHGWKLYIDLKDALGQAIESFTGRLVDFKQPWCLPRSLLRFAVQAGDTTPVHYDQIFLRAGPPTSITAWVPLGDVEVEGGGLVYLDRLSNEERISAFNQNMNKGGWLDQNASRFGKHYKRAWLAANYESGDVVFHTPYTVPAGVQNRSPSGRIRLSTDLRFADKTKPYDKRWTVTAFSEKDENVAR